MKLHLSAPTSPVLRSNLEVTGSKSESNRCLLLQALYPEIGIENLSDSDDAKVMQDGLKIEKGVVDIHHAGTAMRFLTGYFASQEGKVVTLTGSQRMTERPVAVLVEALRGLGADITYEKNEGYPPIRVVGKKLVRNQVSLPANISSQYISSLLLIAPSLENGLRLDLVGKITSIPYIKMTLALLSQIGVESDFEKNTIRVSPKNKVEPTVVTVESDWSSASYYYSIVALSEPGSEVRLSSYKKNSLQGDSVLADIYADFGVETVFGKHDILLKKSADHPTSTFHHDLANAPDIAQTIAVTCFGLGIGCHLTGLHTLKIKETDRLEALHTELTKLGADISVSDKDLTLRPSSSAPDNEFAIKQNVSIDTYDDHRMAMAFAPLALKTDLVINDADVVSKSYPGFWQDLEKLGIPVKNL